MFLRAAGIIGVQMFRGSLKYRCSEDFPVPDSSGWDYIWMGIGDLNWRPFCVPDKTLPNACAGACTNNTLLPSYKTQGAWSTSAHVIYPRRILGKRK